MGRKGVQFYEKGGKQKKEKKRKEKKREKTCILNGKGNDIYRDIYIYTLTQTHIHTHIYIYIYRVLGFLFIEWKANTRNERRNELVRTGIIYHR